MRDRASLFPRALEWFSLLGALGVVAAFLTVTAIVQHYVRSIDGMANTLETNALPSIDHLTIARGALRHVGLAARSLLRAADADRAADREALVGAISVLDREMAAYVELPSFPGERSQSQIAAKDLGVYEKLVEAFLARVAAGDLETARSFSVEELTPAGERADADIERLVRLKADAANRTSHEILAARVRATQLSYLLHVLAAALALFVLRWIARARGGHERMIEERARLESERKELAELRAAELDVFAARVAHDLKNPLAALTIGVRLVDQEIEHPDKVRRSVARMNRAVFRMREMIDGLLAFARAAGPSDTHASTDLRESIDSVLADLEPHAKQAGAVLSLEPMAAIQVACASGPLMSILGNLVGNAVKYIVASPAGARQVRLRSFEEGARVRVEIEDTGPGVPLDAQEQIFNPYVRGLGVTQPGLGLGLATVKRIVEAHGGAVGLRSVVGEGSCFWFDLPRAPAAAESVRRELH